MWLGVLAYVINPRWMRWSRLNLPPSLRWTGAAIGFAPAAVLQDLRQPRRELHPDGRHEE